MTFDSIIKASEEHLSQSRKLATFLKKRQALEKDFASALDKLCVETAVTKKTVKEIAISLTKSNFELDQSPVIENEDIEGKSVLIGLQALLTETKKLAASRVRRHKFHSIHQLTQLNYSKAKISGFMMEEILEFNESIGVAERIHRSLMETGNRRINELQDAFEILKEYKREYDLVASAAREAQEKVRGDVSGNKVEKLRKKHEECVDRTLLAGEKVKVCEELCKDAQDRYHFEDLPKIILVRRSIGINHF